MPDVRIHRIIIADDGRDGIFYREGERWIREHGTEVKLRNLQPHVETRFDSGGGRLSSIERLAIKQSKTRRSCEACGHVWGAYEDNCRCPPSAPHV